MPVVLEVRLIALFLTSALLLTSAPTPFPPDLKPELDRVVQQYLQAAARQRESMLGMQVDLEIDGRFTEAKEQGTMHLTRTISRTGSMDLKDVPSFKGDDRVKKELIARYLDEEEKAKAFGAMSITPQDYDFEIRLIERRGGRTKYVFGVTPRSGGKGKFRGELWIDGQTGMPIRESGQLTSTPSVLVSNMRFTRDYELRNGIAMVTEFRSSTDVHLLGLGRAELNVKFSNYAPYMEQRAEP